MWSVKRLLFFSNHDPWLSSNQILAYRFQAPWHLITRSQGVITKQFLCCCTPQSLGLSKGMQGLNWECESRAIFLGALFSNSPLVKFLSKYSHSNLQLSRPPDTGIWLKFYSDAISVLFSQFGHFIPFSFVSGSPGQEAAVSLCCSTFCLSITNSSRREGEDSFAPFCPFLCAYHLEAPVLFSSASGSGAWLRVTAFMLLGKCAM